jgi:hypothetical protein
MPQRKGADKSVAPAFIATDFLGRAGIVHCGVGFVGGK